MFGRNKAEKAQAKAKKEVEQIMEAVKKLQAKAEAKAKKANLETTWNKKKWERQAKKAADTVREYAHTAGSIVHDYASQGYEWAAPKAQELAEKARPYVDQAKEAGSDFADKMRDDYIPRAKRAAHAVGDAASGNDSIADKARAAAKAANHELTTPEKPKKRHRFGKFLGSLTLLGGVGTAGYFLWKRAQPTEDPWAEAYWKDVDGVKEEAKDKAENAKEEAKDVAENVKDKAKDVAEDVKDKAKEAKDKAEDMGEKAKEGAQHAADASKDKAQELADKAKKSVKDAADK